MGIGMRHGFHCEECGEAVWPATTRAELVWIRNRQHVVKEVAQHMQSGLDSWMNEALDFLDRHGGHSVVLVRQAQ